MQIFCLPRGHRRIWYHFDVAEIAVCGFYFFHFMDGFAEFFVCETGSPRAIIATKTNMKTARNITPNSNSIRHPQYPHNESILLHKTIREPIVREMFLQIPA